MALGKGLESLIPRKSNSTPPKEPSDVSRAEALGAPAGLVSNGAAGGRVQDDRRPRSERTPGSVRETPEGSPSLSFRENISKNISVQPPKGEPLFQKPKKHYNAIYQIEIEKIKPNPFQPRRHFDEVSLQELAQSIREFGVIQPIVVSKIIKETERGTEVEYQLIAGERRLMASKLLGLERVPAIVKKVDEHRIKLELALIENVQRSDLNAIEEAKAYARLQDEFGLAQREIAARVGKSREVVANTLRLLNLPQNIQEAVRLGKINQSQARTLLGIENVEEQNRIFESLLTHRMSVRALRERTSTALPEH